MTNLTIESVNTHFEQNFTYAKKIRVLRLNTYRSGLIDFLNSIELDVIELFVEIGSFTGESSNIFSLDDRIKSIVNVDSWSDPRIDVWNNKRIESCYDLNRTSKMKKMKMTSLQAASLFEDKSIDVVYIDAGHDYENVKQDINLWLPKTKRYIGGHDYNKKSWPDVIKAVDERFGKPHYIFNDCSWLMDITKL